MGAIVAELAAPTIDHLLFDGAGEDGGTGSVEGKTILAGSQIASLLASSLAELDSGDAVNAGRNAVMNNYLMPQEKKELVDKLEACGNDVACKQEVMRPYEDISDQRDDEFDAAISMCSIGDCNELLTLHWDLRMELTKEGSDYYLNHPEEFDLLPPSKAVYHTMKIDPEFGEPIELVLGSNDNKKYIHPVYGYEVVVDNGGRIITNSVNIGTYNFYNPESGENNNVLLSNNAGHFAYDVIPYYVFGNDGDDKTSVAERLIRSLNSSEAIKRLFKSITN